MVKLTQQQKFDNILNYKIKHHWDAKGKKVAQILGKLLTALFQEEEEFSGKRPLGNSGFYDFLQEAVQSEFPNLVLKVTRVNDNYNIEDIEFSVNDYHKYQKFICKFMEYAGKKLLVINKENNNV